MKKIPTLFRRDPDDMRHVLPEVTPGCEWVLAGEGVPTRKFDGTCMMLVEPESLMSVVSLWWARREVKPGKPFPPNFSAVMRDENTGKTVGWEPVAQLPFAKFHAEALADQPGVYEPGTYELVGPKVNGNPEGFPGHILIDHSQAARYGGIPTTFEGLRDMLSSPRFDYEGIVWHHPDGRMAKLKRRDFAREGNDEGTKR
jgi:Family of unknown function (DUF5565)